MTDAGLFARPTPGLPRTDVLTASVVTNYTENGLLGVCNVLQCDR